MQWFGSSDELHRRDAALVAEQAAYETERAQQRCVDFYCEGFEYICVHSAEVQMLRDELSIRGTVRVQSVLSEFSIVRLS